jgi:hypothetical protein
MEMKERLSLWQELEEKINELSQKQKEVEEEDAEYMEYLSLNGGGDPDLTYPEYCRLKEEMDRLYEEKNSGSSYSRERLDFLQRLLREV